LLWVLFVERPLQTIWAWGRTIPVILLVVLVCLIYRESIFIGSLHVAALIITAMTEIHWLFILASCACGFWSGCIWVSQGVCYNMNMCTKQRSKVTMKYSYYEV
jgi:branched-subunit amino acid transport protein AzlD